MRTLLVLGLMAAAIPAWAVPPDIARDAIDLIGRADTKGREAPRVIEVVRQLMRDAEGKAEEHKP